MRRSHENNITIIGGIDLMDYKQILQSNEQFNCSDGKYMSMDDALDVYATFKLKKNPESKPNTLEPIINEAVDECFIDLQDYWVQFGFLDKANKHSFASWLVSNYMLNLNEDFVKFRECSDEWDRGSAPCDGLTG
jgi:hypothetical protein